MDEDLAREWLAASDGEEPEHQERLNEWSPDHSVLASIHDRIAELVALTVNVNSKSGGHKPSYLPRPKSALSLLKEEQDFAELNEVLGGLMD